MKEIISVILLTTLSLYSISFTPPHITTQEVLAETETNEIPPLAIQVPPEENKELTGQNTQSPEIIPLATPSRVDHIPEVKKQITKAPIFNPVKEITSVRKVEEKIRKENFDINKLAKAVARHETASCTKWYGKEYNNCFWIKNWNTAPCPKIGRNRMCIYATQEESYEAFKKIWIKWYGGMPTLASSRRWSGNDNAGNWMKNVTSFYYKQF